MQPPFLFFVGTKAIAERSPLILQSFLGNGFLNSDVLVVEFAVFHKSKHHRDSVSVFLLIIVGKILSRIGER